MVWNFYNPIVERMETGGPLRLIDCPVQLRRAPGSIRATDSKLYVGSNRGELPDGNLWSSHINTQVKILIYEYIACIQHIHVHIHMQYTHAHTALPVCALVFPVYTRLGFQNIRDCQKKPSMGAILK